MGLSDGVLMQKVKEGDLSHAALLFHRHHKKIYHYLGKMSGDYHLAEDLTQNVFEKLIQYRKSFDSAQNFEGWVYQIAKNTFIDHVTQHKKLPVRSGLESLETMPAMIDGQREEEEDAKLSRAMAALSEDDRELLILTRFKKMKYHEVAAMQQTTENNIKVKVYRAVEKLRTHFFQLESL